MTDPTIISADISLRNAPEVIRHMKSGGFTRELVMTALWVSPRVLFEMPTLLSEMTDHERREIGKSMIVSSHDTESEWIRIGHIFPSVLPDVANHILRRYTEITRSYRKNRHWQWASQHTEYCVKRMRTFVLEYPQFSTPFLTRMLRGRMDWSMIGHFVQDRPVNWNPHLRSVQNWLLETSYTSPGIMDSLMSSGLWNFWLQYCLFSVKSPGWMLQKSIENIPSPDATRWQERFFKAGKLDVAVDIAHRFPDSPGPGRDHLQIQSIHNL